TLVVVEEFKGPFPQLHDCHVGRRTHVERTAIIERREHARSIDGRTCNYLAERHAKHDELRHHVREVNDARGLRHDVPIRGDGTPNSGDEAWINFRFSRALPPGASRSRRDERHSIRWTLPGGTTYLPRPRRRRLRSATKAKWQCWLSAKLV